MVEQFTFPYKLPFLCVGPGGGGTCFFIGCESGEQYMCIFDNPSVNCL